MHNGIFDFYECEKCKENNVGNNVLTFVGFWSKYSGNVSFLIYNPSLLEKVYFAG